MPLSDHVEHTRRSDGDESRSTEMALRTGIPLDLNDSPSLLSPLLSHLPSIPTIKNLLPMSPPKPLPSLHAQDNPKAWWQDVDLGGRRPLLLVSSRSFPLQIFAFCSGNLPVDPHVQETFPAPEEIFSLAQIEDAGDIVQNLLVPAGVETVVAARILERSPVGVRLALLTTQIKTLTLVIIDMSTGLATHRIHLGTGTGGTISSSPRAIAISTSTAIHILHPTTLTPLLPAFTSLPACPNTNLPVFALSGRLLAYTTTEPALSPGPDGLGSIVTSQSSRTASPETTLSSAVGIGGGVARGVWAGVKMGARAAGRAGSGRLAKSAPADGRPLSDRDESENDDTHAGSQGEWIKIVDLFPSQSPTPRLIAHFRLPTRSIPQHPRPQLEPITYLSFSPDGTTLFVASDGKIFHLFDIHPVSLGARLIANARGEVWQTYELKRGHTAAKVHSVVWTDRWIGVGTGRGTAHVFPISPSGGPPSSSSHATLKTVNPTQLYPLSTHVSPAARIRTSDDSSIQSPAVFTFLAYRENPIHPSNFCQDIAIYRPASGVIELTRLNVHASNTDTPVNVQLRRGSGLTEMMQRAGLGQGDLAVESCIKARWGLPPGDDPLYLDKIKSTPVGNIKTLAQAEIQTYCTNPHILPTSIYLSKQVDFFAARPTDEYTPLSLLETSSRLHHLPFRHDVQAQPGSFDEPLLSALQTVIEPRPATSPIPGLPNGYGRTNWSSIPIRHVAQGLGESVDRVRREYARAQYVRTKARKTSEVTHGSLSFEDDTVFRVPGVEDEDGEGSGSNATSRDYSSSSRDITGTESSVDGEEWEIGWEEEYRKAVEDDGPDDLILGLLDEEERGWNLKK